MKKGLLLGSLITGCGFFSMQASAQPPQCDITLRTDSFHNSTSSGNIIRIGHYVRFGAYDERIQAGDIIKDVEIPLNWTHKNPKNVNIQVDHIDMGAGGANAIINSGNELWAEDAAMGWERSEPGVKTEIIKKGMVSFSGVGPVSDNLATSINDTGFIFYRFNRLNKTLEKMPPAWCDATKRHYVNLFVPADTFGLPDIITVWYERPSAGGNLRSMNLLEMDGLGFVPPVTVPYDIVKKIGIDVPPTLDFGRVDTGVVAKKDIDVRLTYVGIPGRGVLTFSYAGAQNMEVTVREKSESQDTPLPYHKYIDQLTSNTISLPYQIGVKGNIARSTEQLVKVTFQVF
ncbi:hypothetical protein LQJ90_004270 [Salmonella enterica]|nr:hypothetical protein [Salmonella enterica]